MLLLYHVIVLSVRELEPFQNNTLFVLIVLRHSLLLYYIIRCYYVTLLYYLRLKDLKSSNRKSVDFSV